MDEHQKKLQKMPRDIREAHVHSTNHRIEIESSSMCGCFYCCSVFRPTEILDWCDENENNQGQTALCPRCGVDSVIGTSSGFPITSEFLLSMKGFWF